MSEDLAAGELSIRPLAESGLLVEFPNVIDPMVVEQVMALTAAPEAAQPPGLHDIVPSYRTIQLAFDPVETDGDTLAGVVRQLAAGSSTHESAAGREVTIPVAHGGAQGPDLADVAAHTGLAPDEVCERHAVASYRVACMGFAPGFGFWWGCCRSWRRPVAPPPALAFPPAPSPSAGRRPVCTPASCRAAGTSSAAPR